MKSNKIVLYLIFLLNGISFLYSCGRQNTQLTEKNTEQDTTINFGNPVSELGQDINFIFQDKNNNFWFATKGNGVYFYDGNSIVHITEKDGLCSNIILKIEEDINENLWFTTTEGACTLNNQHFVNYTNTIQNSPYGILNYQRGGLFFSHSKGICFFDGKSFTNFTISPVAYKQNNNDLYQPYGAYCILADKSGKIWFGTEKGVCCYDGKSFSYITDKNLEGPAVRSIFQDTDGKLWFGNNGGGLYSYDGNHLRNITEERNLGNSDFLQKQITTEKPGSLARVFAINEDTHKNLWIGTIDAGVWKFDGTNLTNFTTKDGLSGNSISLIYKDKKGKLWFVANGTVNYFDGKEFILRRKTEI